MNIIIDGHLDLAYNAVVLNRDLRLPVASIRDQERGRQELLAAMGNCTVSVPALLEGGIAVVGASLFVEPYVKARPTPFQTYRTPEEAERYAAMQLDAYQRLSDDHEAVRVIQTRGDLDATVASWETEQRWVGLFIVMEGAEPILRIDDLAHWVERGVRGIGLSWAAGTRYAGGNGNPGPLTDEGRRLIYAMADYNLLLDISHLWEAAADDVLDLYPGPIVASHANPRRFVDSPRMLSDTYIRRVAERDGVIGVVAFNRHLDALWREGEPRLPLMRLIDAIDHICQLTGDARYAGIGSDLDGGFGLESTLAEIDTVADLRKIEGLLAERGYRPADVAAILNGNWQRVMRAALSAF